MRSLAAPALLGVALMASTACTGVHGGVFVATAPPPPIAERVVVAPGPGYVWVPGYYTWNGGAYVWVGGRYMLPPRGRHAWVPPHWERQRRGWYFIQGHWR